MAPIAPTQRQGAFSGARENGQPPFIRLPNIDQFRVFWIRDPAREVYPVAFPDQTWVASVKKTFS
jgi:hypothetical protein